MSTLVETRHLKKYFKVSKGMLHAVDDVDLTIEEGETLGVVGYFEVKKRRKTSTVHTDADDFPGPLFQPESTNVCSGTDC